MTGVIEAAHMARQHKQRQGHQVVALLLKNDFENIPAGYTGVTMRGLPFQVVPNEALTEIKEICLGGFECNPEAKRLDVLTSDALCTEYMCHQVVEVTYEFLRKKYPDA